MFCIYVLFSVQTARQIINHLPSISLVKLTKAGGIQHIWQENTCMAILRSLKIRIAVEPQLTKTFII